MQQGSNGTSMLSDEQILDMELTAGGELVPRAGEGDAVNRRAANGDTTNGSASATQLSGTQPARNQTARTEHGVILNEVKDLSAYIGMDGQILRRLAPQNDSRSDAERDMALLDGDALLGDDAILRADGNAGDPTRVAGRSNVAANDAANGDPARVAAENAATRTTADGGPARAATQETDPAWLTALDAQPQGGREAAAEARAWRAAATDVASLDAAYFSADAGARSGLAARLYDNDPGAFRAMLAESARTMALRDPQGFAELARELAAASQSAGPLTAASAPTLLNAISSDARLTAANRNALRNAADPHASPAAANAQALLDATRYQSRLIAANSEAPVARVARQDIFGEQESYAGRDTRLFSPADAVNASGLPHSGRPELHGPNAQQQAAAQSQASTQANAFPAEAYRSFEASTNEDVARRVHRAIDHTLGTTLPEGMAEGARRRIAEDIFQEVHASLAADRDLARRLGETLRDWRFDAAARQQVSSLLTGRARAVLPEVARRVVAEWTSSVLATDRAKTARIDAASARRDITGGHLPEPVPASSLRPRDLDYRRLSDEQIMEL